MVNKIDKNKVRQKRHSRIRAKISGTSAKPRLNVYRSTNHIYVQVIDDENGNTLVACSTLDKAIASKISGMTKKEQSKVIGQETAKKAIKKGIKEVVFDRGGYLYTGRIKEVADGAREAGLEF